MTISVHNVMISKFTIYPNVFNFYIVEVYPTPEFGTATTMEIIESAGSDPLRSSVIYRSGKRTTDRSLRILESWNMLEKYRKTEFAYAVVQEFVSDESTKCDVNES